MSIHTQSHLCILKLDSLFIVPIVRFSAVSLYAKRFLSYNQNFYATQKIRWSATYGDSVFISQFWRRITNYYSDWTFSLNKLFYWGSFQSWKVKRHVLWQDYNWIIYLIQSNLKEKHGGKEYCSTIVSIVGKWKMIQSMQ